MILKKTEDPNFSLMPDDENFIKNFISSILASLDKDTRNGQIAPSEDTRKLIQSLIKLLESWKKTGEKFGK